MIATLLKHEWLRTRSMLATIAGMAVLLTVLGGLLTMTGWPLVATLGMVGAGVVVAVLVPALQLALAADYWRSSYGRTGYFTQSLPIRGSRIYTAKLIWAVAVTLVAVVISVLLFLGLWTAISAQDGGLTNPLPDLAGLWAQLTDVTPVWLLVSGGLTLVALYLIWPVQYYFSVSVGHERGLNRLGAGGPVLVFIGLYFAMQVLSLAGMFALPVGIGLEGETLAVVPFSFVDELGLNTGTSSDVMPLGFLPALILVAAICLWRTVRSWNHKVSLV